MHQGTNVVLLADERRHRAERHAAIEADAKRLVETSSAYGALIAVDAHAATERLQSPLRALNLTVERFFLREALTRSRRAWRKEYGKDEGLRLAKLTEPIVRIAFWDNLDEINPITVIADGIEVLCIRGWADRAKVSA